MNLKKVEALGLALCLAAGVAGTTVPVMAADDTIVLWSSTTGPDGELIQKNIDAYNATEPAYKIEVVAMEAGTFNTKLTTVGKSGKGVPDLALLASEAVDTYYDLEMLEPLDAMLEGTEIKKENYVEAAWNVGTKDGQQYGVPSDMGTWVMYYNKELADKYVPGATDDGIITYAEIEAAGAAAKADGVYSYANTWSMQNYTNLYLQMGGQWLNEEGKVSVNNEYSKQVVEELKKLKDEGWMVPQGEDASKLFMNQQLIFLPEGTWMLSQMKGITDFEWVETFTPQWDAENMVQCTGAAQFAMFKAKEEKSEEKKQGIVDFLTWLQGNQLDWIQSGTNPASLSMLENEEYLKMPQSFLLTTEEGRNALSVVAAPGLSYVLSEYDARAWDMINGSADIVQTFDEIQKIVDQKMK